MIAHTITASEVAEAVAGAVTRIRPEVQVSPIVELPAISAAAGVVALGKLETVHPTGSFKVRGALNLLRCHAEQAQRKGVIAASTGNHGRAVAWAAALLGMPCSVFVSELVPRYRCEAIEAHGAAVRVEGRSFDEAEARAVEACTRSGALYAPPFNHLEIIAGQGTIALELCASTTIGTVLIPISGGGLAAGVAAYFRHHRPMTRLVGVSAERAATMHDSLAAGTPLHTPELPTIADSLSGGIGGASSLTFHLLRQCLDDLILVGETEITAAMRFAHDREGLVLEGAGAVSIAALLHAEARHFPSPLIAILTGRNVSPEWLAGGEQTPRSATPSEVS